MSKVHAKASKSTNFDDEPEIKDKAVSNVNRLMINDCISYHTAYYPKPFIVGSFCVCNNRKTLERTYVKGRAYIKYLSLPFSRKCSFDLNEGFDIGVKNGVSHELEMFLRWIVDNKSKFIDETESANLGIDFICYRGTLSKIMVSVLQIKLEVVKLNFVLFFIFIFSLILTKIMKIG